MPSHIRGPFIEFECSECGRTVQSNADMSRDQLHEMIVAKNNDPKKRICAGCWHPDRNPKP